jgi:ABC-2 type transport system ATP-binding protein
MPAIETHVLAKDYTVGFWRPRPYRALDGLTLAVEPGEVFGFLGPNGAGKTTTLKLLMQLVYPTSGTASILGRPLGDLAMKRRIGYLPENPYFYDYLTAEELLTYFAGLFGYRGPDRAKRVGRLLDEVGLGAERRLQLRKFSKGMIQRVGLAQTLINDPEVVFLDEPMSGLDPLGRRDVRALILRLRDAGRTVFFSSHILSDAETLCSRIAIVAKGRLMASGTLADLVTAQLKGWEIVLDGLPQPPSAAHPGVRAVTTIAPGRYAVDALPAEDPLQLARELAGAGGRLVSITQVHDTLEDLFVRQVDQASGTDRFAATPPAAAAGGGR